METKVRWAGLSWTIPQHVSGFLCIVDGLAMRLACAAWSHVNLHTYERVVQSFMEDFPKNEFGRPTGRDFVEKMLKHNIVLSGGRLLRILYGMPAAWGRGDIDLYTKADYRGCATRCKECVDGPAYGHFGPGSDMSFLEDWNPCCAYLREQYPHDGHFTPHEFTREVYGDAPPDDLTPRSIINLNRYRYRTDSGPGKPRHPSRPAADTKDWKNPVHLDYIRIHTNFKGGVPRFIAQGFDISICKNMFRAGPDGKGELRIMYIDHLFERKFASEGVASVFGETYTEPDDVKKEHQEYVARAKDRVAKKCAERIAKYGGRGFTCIARSINISTYRVLDWFDESPAR